MSDTPTGFPGKTARLDRTSKRHKVGATPDPEPSASASSFELTIEEDMGRTIAGRYEITDVIGEGGMGVVYEAYDPQTDRKVAIKLVRAECATDRKFITRFRREMEVTTQLRHPSTIRVFEHGETEDGRPFMVMELLRGESLADRLERGPIPELEALQYARQIAESLSEAHEHGIFHRDLKPDNIFIEKVGVSKVVKVLDFGIAGGVDATRLTQAGEVFGTPQYMSPEQCNGLPLDHRTDIYSLGIILYEMIEGRPPFSADSPMATMLKHVRSKVPVPRKASRTTIKLLMQALRKDRSKRIQTAEDFARRIGEAIGAVRAEQEGRPVDASSNKKTAGRPTATRGGISAPIPLGPPPKTSNPVLWGGIVVAVLAAAGIGYALLSGDDAPPRTEHATDGEEAKGAGEAKALPRNRALVNTNVKGADVLLDGKPQCKTPCTVAVPVGDGKTHEIRVTKDGYVDVVTNWQPKSASEPLPPLPDMKPL
ncbi:MAG: PEGA domain-containing protein [Deltaproteobacteria bacterium]|nr:MAG: PEGA domain-containing protein [Deltaproteobacteria bacterium]